MNIFTATVASWGQQYKRASSIVKLVLPTKVPSGCFKEMYFIRVSNKTTSYFEKEDDGKGDPLI